MREYWANVYAGVDGVQGMIGVAHAGQHHETRDDADFYGRDKIGDLQHDLICRVHVRLKPEGAPRRYANEANRRAWEDTPNICRVMVQNGSRADRIV